MAKQSIKATHASKSAARKAAPGMSMAQARGSRGHPNGGGGIRCWEDDPLPAVAVIRPVPDPAAGPLAYSFPQPAPPPRAYQPGTPAFRYWVAVEALRRGADFWAPRVPGGRWQMGPTLGVLLDQGQDLNAFYDRTALNFFHGPGAHGTVFSGESPDILCHEMGHAILDAVKPALWDAGSQEAAAFHESFGDMSALLSGLQLQSLRIAVLRETQGHLIHNSRLSRLAEQLGEAIRVQAPDAVDPDCLRNAANSFSYRDPVDLPSRAPAVQLSSEPHSFSRVFTGAFLEILASALAATAQSPGAPTEQELLKVSGEMADILIAGVRNAAVVVDFFAQVASAMLAASASVNPAYPALLKAVFVRRSMLSLETATPVVRDTLTAAAAAGAVEEPLAPLMIDASHYGLDRQLSVLSPTQKRRFNAAAAAASFGSLTPKSADVAARAFVEDLFQRGKVDYRDNGDPALRNEPPHTLKTHSLVAVGTELRLQRRLCDCGLSR